MKEETIMTQHPEGKQGVNISKAKYNTMRGAMVGEMKGKFEGSIPWYFESVKLDLEARKVIERVPGKKPQHVRLME
ncbi:MAG: hypothetical protein JSW38_11000 [Dehalococcoidia bacterium]|nr:MAG: hypothetical protein JSW38_11000 [Dehalococcoidia bacterium]